jgi:polyphenol oxidase
MGSGMSDTDMITSAKLAALPGLTYGMSTRKGGVSPEPLGMNLSFRVGDEHKNVEENRRRFFGALGLDARDAAIPRQCHSANIQIVTSPGEFESTDALITTTVGLPLVITVADCLSIVLYDPEKSVLAHVHAGWRGTMQQIVSKCVRTMSERLDVSPKTIVAFLGPSAGVCCYEVGSEVSVLFSAAHLQDRDGRTYLNLKSANLSQLLECGVTRSNVEVSEWCTICNPGIFHSYRRDRDRSGRMMAAASLLIQKGS